MATHATVTRDPEHKREAILDAALHLFAARGFHGVAVPEVAQKAKVGTGTIYRYFPSKEALVNAVYQREKTALGLALAPLVKLHDLPPRAQLHDFFSAASDFALKNPVSMTFLELHHHDYLDKESRALEERIMAPARAFIECSQEALAIKELDPELLIAVIWGIFAALVRAHHEKRLTLDKATLQAAEECAWEAIRA